MARKSTTIQTPAAAVLSLEDMRQAIPRIQKRVEMVQAFDPRKIDLNDPYASVRPLRASIQEALTRTFGHDTVEYRRYVPAADFDWPMYFGEQTPPHEIVEGLTRSRTRSIDLLAQAMNALQERIEEAQTTSPASEAEGASGISNRKVFLVHGHDLATRESVARFLEKANFEPVVLHEQANQGRTIIEKFEYNADVGFAVIVLSPDDIGSTASAPDNRQPRARQNVILELGYFIG
jgi:hypothetical protein